MSVPKNELCARPVGLTEWNVVVWQVGECAPDRVLHRQGKEGITFSLALIHIIHMNVVTPSYTFTPWSTTSVLLSRLCNQQVHYKSRFSGCFSSFVSIFKAQTEYLSITYAHVYRWLNLISCSYSTGGLQVKGTLILILLKKCWPASESNRLSQTHLASLFSVYCCASAEWEHKIPRQRSEPFH